MFPYQITDRGVTVFIDSSPRQFAKTHSQYDLIVAAIHAGDDEAVRAHTDVIKSITLQTEGRVRIVDNSVFVGDREVHGNIVERILAMVAMKSKAVDGLVKFLDRVHNNVSKSVLDELFDFIEACDLPMTEDGCFLTYKFVKEDFTDCRTGTFDNSVGQSPEMPRNEVDDRRDVTCSTGLHVCSLQYLVSNNWGRRIIVCKVAPEDVVSVPTEYGNAKMRVCKYTVVDCINYDDGERIKPWFDDQYDTKPEVDEPEVDEPEVDEPEVEVFDVSATIKSLNEIGPDEAAITAFLEVLDDELDTGQDTGLGDWHVASNDAGGVGVMIWRFEADDVPVIHLLLEPEKLDNIEPAIKKSKGKLTVDQVREIKALKSDWTNGVTTLTAIGKAYGVHREQIARIFRGETWKEVT